MLDPIYTLSWPRDLFEWEARRVLECAGPIPLSESIPLLLREAFSDADIEKVFEQETGEFGFRSRATGDPTVVEPKDWLQALLLDEARLRSHVEPNFWAQRHGYIAEDETSQKFDFLQAFIATISEMEEHGYFPLILPRRCIDDSSEEGEVATANQISRAIHFNVPWPIAPEDMSIMPRPIQFSLIEYFHDQAQRPRTADFHSFGRCGWHYANFNRESGGAVYRFKVNALLEKFSEPVRLGAQGEERGRVVRYFGTVLDERAEVELKLRRHDDQDEVLTAVQVFRNRNSSTAAKRGALQQLAKALEPRRKQIGDRLTKQDESDLFNIANNFQIRHNNPKQQNDYDSEYLDWIFWMFLATNRLMDEIEKR